MTDFVTLKQGPMEARVSAFGGAVVDASFAGTPILRPYVPDDKHTTGKAASFPLVPFGNRVAGNTFSLDGHAYDLAPNTEWDRHYLHGDGWQSEWQIVARTAATIELGLEHIGPVYCYAGRQSLSVEDGQLRFDLRVTNQGKRPMPFGLGHHPFFPLTPKTTLRAPATSYWTEKNGFLPDRLSAVPSDLDFSIGRALPRRWVNNGFEGWSGAAEIAWPERDLAVDLAAGPELTRYFVFVSDKSFEPDFADDYFCFEPMTHSADGHHLPDLGGLRLLRPSETLATKFSITPRWLHN